MVLVLFAVVGFSVGYWLEMSRAGYVTMSLTAVAFSAGQIALLLLTSRRDLVTILPLIIGLLLTSFMLFGSLVRFAFGSRSRSA